MNESQPTNESRVRWSVWLGRWWTARKERNLAKRHAKLEKWYAGFQREQMLVREHEIRIEMIRQEIEEEAAQRRKRPNALMSDPAAKT